MKVKKKQKLSQAHLNTHTSVIPGASQAIFFIILPWGVGGSTSHFFIKESNNSWNLRNGTLKLVGS